MLFYIIMGRWEIYQQVELKLKDVEIELAKKDISCTNWGNSLLIQTENCQIIIGCGIEEDTFEVTSSHFCRDGSSGSHWLIDITLKNFVSEILSHIELYLSLSGNNPESTN